MLKLHRHSAPCRPSSLARCLLDKMANPFLDGCRQPFQGKGGWPNITLIEFCILLKTERGVPRFEFLAALEEANNLAVLRISWHPIPGSRSKSRSIGFDDSVDPLGNNPILLWHFGDLREYVPFPVNLTRANASPLIEGLPHCGSFLGLQQRRRLATGARDRCFRGFSWALNVCPPA